MSNYWINVIATTHTVSCVLLYIVGMITAVSIMSYLCTFDEISNKCHNYTKHFLLISIQVFVFLILIYIFTSPIN